MKGAKGYQGPPMAVPHHHHPQIHYAFIGMCTKCCLTCINVFLGMLGMLAVLVGAFGLYLSIVIEERTRYDLRDMYMLGTNISGAMLPLGTALVVVSIAGCIGACQENIALLKLYMWVLGVFLIIEICVIVGSFLVVWKAGELINNSLSSSLIEDYRPSTESILDTLQSKLECCGLSVNGYTDYNRNPLYNCYDSNQSLQRCSVPGSCCKPAPQQNTAARDLITAVNNDSFSCAQGTLGLEVSDAREVIYTEGCTVTLTSLFRTLLYTLVSFMVLCALIKMYVVYQVRTLLNQIAMLHFSVY